MRALLFLILTCVGVCFPRCGNNFDAFSQLRFCVNLFFYFYAALSAASLMSTLSGKKSLATLKMAF